jgi:repressor LexA
MNEVTRRQRQILDYIQQFQETNGMSPTVREIGKHFGFASPRSVSDHLEALTKKGVLMSDAKIARSLRPVSPLQSFRNRVIHIPIYGSIPAGFAENKTEEVQGCVSVDIATLGIKPSPRLFALKVSGDSMIGRHILNGDVVVVEHGKTPRTGDVVAALIDGESTLKTFVMERGEPYLKAENPRYPKLIPSRELVIQGVVLSIIRQLT